MLIELLVVLAGTVINFVFQWGKYRRLDLGGKRGLEKTHKAQEELKRQSAVIKSSVTQSPPEQL